MNRIAALSLSSAAAGALILSGAGAAQAKIVVQDSIAKVSIGDSTKQVRNMKGSPDSKKSIATEIPAGTSTFWYYGNKGKKLTVQFFDKTVYSVSTRSAKQKTDTGLHVGSSKQDMLNDYPDVRREAHGLYELGARQAGFNLTIFRIKQKQITEITVAKYTGE